MKPYFSIFVFFLIPVVGFSQSTGRSAAIANFNLDDHARLVQYLWGYAKCNAGKSEKSAIDFNAIGNWRGLGGHLSVNEDGQYIAYTINKPTGTRYWFNRLDSLVIQSTHNNWKAAFAGSNPGFFTTNSRQYIFQQGETLCMLRLGKSQFINIKNVISYKLSQRGKNEYLAYQLKKNDSNVVLNNLFTGKETFFSGITEYNFDNRGEWLVGKRANDLLLYNLATGAQKQFPFVVAYAFSPDGKTLLLKAIEKSDKGSTTSLHYLAAPNWQEKSIWSTNEEKATLASYSLDNSGRQIIFSVNDSSGAHIWYYNTEMDKAMVKLTHSSPGIGNGLTLTGDLAFSNNGRYIKCMVQPAPPVTTKPDADMAQVEVWDHKDLYLQSAQAEFSKRPEPYTAFINVENNKVIPLENKDRKLYLQQGDFAIVKKYPADVHGDRFWEVSNVWNEDSNWLVSLKDGSSHLLPTKAGNDKFWFSPGGRYLVYFDLDKSCHFFCYDLHTGVLKNISANVPANQLGLIDRYSDKGPGTGKLAAWIADDAGVLVYDNYDIWKLDLTGKEPAINITNGFGQSNNIIFNLFTTNRYVSEVPVIKASGLLRLRAFNTRNKQNGYYWKTDLKAGDPKLSFMGGYFMHLIDGCHDLNLSNEGLAPVKAKNREVWIVQRQSSTDAPNYYETSDFKSFNRLTNYQPQQHFKWLTEELHPFKHLDGREGQGILYKPEDFDPTKKYPVIIVFYGAFSDNLYQFHAPAYIDHAVASGKSPVWLVNNGYLVFTPDIYTTPLKYGPSAFNVIEGAAQYLKQLPYVNADKLGCASHSSSAKLGAYLFTHSSSISATAISEGFIYANPINIALSARNGRSQLENVETGQEYGNLWENKAAWLDQTTVLQADKAKSPLLLFCNKESSADYQDQTLQLFTALRRLEKAVWWLKYDNGSHTLQDLKELKDYTIRYTQFFDHYLKEAPAPLWMTQGIPLTLKGIESRYELDPRGRCGKDCNICKKWNEQYKKHPDMFNKPIQEWHWK
jgi:dipeptidyl aminopeptidase/acylaminoacyl peptidase